MNWIDSLLWLRQMVLLPVFYWVEKVMLLLWMDKERRGVCFFLTELSLGCCCLEIGAFGWTFWSLGDLCLDKTFERNDWVYGCVVDCFERSICIIIVVYFFYFLVFTFQLLPRLIRVSILHIEFGPFLHKYIVHTYLLECIIVWMEIK